jgi:hypothetical protein
VEEIVFDKAEEAERRELEIIQLQQAIAVATEALKEADEAERARLQGSIEQAKSRLDELDMEAGKPVAKD